MRRTESAFGKGVAVLPVWLGILSWLSLGCAAVCAVWLTVEQFRRRQSMPVMSIVWPVSALYLGPFAVWAYYAMGVPREGKKPFWQSAFVAVTHCGAGCTLGDIAAEWLIFLTGFTFAGDRPGRVFQSYLVADYVFAYLLGIGFQYFSIAPMRGISGLRGVWAAIKADTLSLTAFEVGLFGWMAFVHFVAFHPDLTPRDPAYWFMMQVGMCIGFLTAYPMNWWLLKRGIKETM